MKAHITLAQYIGMWLRHVPARKLVALLRELESERIPVSIFQLETHFLAGGDPELCTKTLIQAQRAGKPLSWIVVSSIDIAGKDPLAAFNAGADLNRLIGGAEYQGKFMKRTQPGGQPSTP